ncbi:MAG: AAA family ATPase [Clostridium sp.]
MIIRKINIIAFAGVCNKVIEFEKHTNVIYGETEAGKSTIQNFIRIWLYGISSKRSKDLRSNERLKFSPISGEKIMGELYIESNGLEYIIKRSFGTSKKDDTFEILDALTGDEIKNIGSHEVGKYFLGVNGSTFVRTLFISQLGVVVNKDREEEMMERATNLLGSGEEKVSIHRATEKLEAIRKSLTTTRKTGSLDIARIKMASLLEERYEGYKLSEENLNKEQLSINLKEKNLFLRKELKNLDIYKKYIKKVKLQKEYEDITEYLKKSEELKKKERYIEESISLDGVIDESLINDIKEENTLYLSLLDLKGEGEEELKENEDELQHMREKFKDLLFIEKLETSVKDNFLRITIEQESLKEKIAVFEQLNNDIKKVNEDISLKEESIGHALEFKSVRNHIDSLLRNYEDKLKELKFRMENEDNNSRIRKDEFTLASKFKNSKIILTINVILILLGLVILKGNILVLAPLIIMCIYFGKRTFDLGVESKVTKGNKSSVLALENLNKEIEKIEEELFSYKKKVHATTYEDFMSKLKLFDNFSKYEERELYKISEKELQLSIIDITNIKSSYKNNMDKINNIIEISNSNDVNEVLEKLSRYEIANKEVLSLQIEVDKGREGLNRIISELKIREDRIREKLESIGLSNIDLIELEDKLKEIKEKLIQREDLRRSLQSIEETYKALTKGKDIEHIKEELKDIINENIKYSYTTEEEIDEQVSKKSHELIEVEKSIKDVENEINTRFMGKRTIPEIEEEIETISEVIRKDEMKLKATKLAMEKLQEAFREVRGNFGPLLNEKVLENFKRLTNNKYEDVMVSDSYEIKVKNKNTILAGELLSNGANDQLYLSLRLAFISMLYKDCEVPVILDDAFVQYDDERVSQVLDVLTESSFGQLIIFTCQSREKYILDKKNIKNNYILL